VQKHDQKMTSELDGNAAGATAFGLGLFLGFGFRLLLGSVSVRGLHGAGERLVKIVDIRLGSPRAGRSPDTMFEFFRAMDGLAA
jgi:hypothetical protein